MSEPNRTVSIDSLLEHASWVRGLARSLVGPDRADDLTQDVWVSALGRPPGTEGSLRGWLGRVLVNRARLTHRGEVRRKDRENFVAAEERVDDPIERLATHRDLVERLAELDDPWQRTLLLRYFDGLSLKEIAAQEGVPIPTVNTRLRKAKELLRARLDDAHGGDRRAWMLALAPFARELPPLAPLLPVALPGLGAPLLFMKLPYVLTAVAAALVAVFFVLPDREVDAVLAPLEAHVDVEQPSSASSQDAAPHDLVSVAEDGQRVEESAEKRDELEAPAATPLNLLVGHVIDAAGAPMADLDLWLAGDKARKLGVSAADGTFDVNGDLDVGRIEVRSDEWGTVLACELPPGARVGPTLIVAPWIEFGGFVRNEEGESIEKAKLVVAQPQSLRASVPDLNSSSSMHEPVTTTDEMGGFRFEKTLAVDGSRLYVEAHGYSSMELAIPLDSTRGFEIVMRRPSADEGVVQGKVVDGVGRGVLDAWVSLGHRCVKTDVSGEFELLMGREGNYDRIVAAKPGQLPAVLERPVNAQTGEAQAWPEFVVLQLGGAPLEVAGRVIDAQGEPLANWKVWLADPTFFSSIDQRGVMVEGIALDLLNSTDADVAPTAAWPWTRTDADGRFVLGGLMDREYRLKVFDAPNLLLVEFGPYQAGRRDIELVLDSSALYGPVAGRVIDPEGAPIAGISISTSVTTYIVPHGDSGFLIWNEAGATATTDDEGRYRFERLPHHGVSMHLTHPYILPADFDVKSAPDGSPAEREAWDAIDFVCQRRFHLQITMRPGLAEHGVLTLLDAAGKEVLIQVFTAGGHMSTRRYSVEENKTDVLSLPGDVRELVLTNSEGVEVVRREISLVFGELNSLEL